jgi:hypothetical protein
MAFLLWRYLFLILLSAVSTITASSNRDFFNREKELAAYRSVLREASLLAITGPRNAGKSWLVKKLLEDYPSKIDFDLREVHFRNSLEFCERLRDEFRNFFEQLRSYLSTVGFQYQFIIKFEWSDSKTKCDLQDVFSRIEAFLEEKERASTDSTKTVLDAMTETKGFPIIWIDEAHKLDSLRATEEGTTALQSLFEWFVKVTKQNRKFVVMLSSSDSFFLEWLTERHVRPYVDTYVVGDLDKNDAKKFYHHLSCDIEKPDFEKVYEIFGGRMFDIEKFLILWQATQGNLDFENYTPIEQATSTLRHALKPEFWHKQHSDLPYPVWTKPDLLKAMQMIVNGGCWIKRALLEEEIGEEIVKSWLQHNILHYRPSNHFTFDIPQAEVITPERPFECVAMKKLLEQQQLKKYDTGSSSSSAPSFVGGSDSNAATKEAMPMEESRARLKEEL